MDIKRKAELFDNVMKGVEGLFPDEDLYEILRGAFKMTDAEIKEAGVQFADSGWHVVTTLLGIMNGATKENGYAPAQPCKLKDLIHCPLPNSTYLEHDLIDMGFLPVGGLAGTDLTPEARAEWADVLDADVRRIFPGAYGIHIEVGNVDPDRLSDFSFTITVGQVSEQQPKMDL